MDPREGIRTEKRAGGIEKEIVRDYIRIGGDTTVIPTAPTDGLGGRPGLDSKTILPPPIDDPTFDELVESQGRGGLLGQVATPIKPAPPPPRQEEIVAAPEYAALPPPPNPSASMQVGRSKEASLPQKPGEAPRFTLSEVREAVSGALAEREGRQADVPAVSERPSQDEKSSTSFVEVTLEGDWGRFRIKVSDVVICPNHIALLYTGLGGDRDLTYEPPLRKPFKLIVPLSNGSHESFLVANFGLLTTIARFDAVVVVFVKCQPPSQEEDLDQEEHHSL